MRSTKRSSASAGASGSGSGVASGSVSAVATVGRRASLRGDEKPFSTSRSRSSPYDLSPKLRSESSSSSDFSSTAPTVCRPERFRQLKAREESPSASIGVS